MTLIKFKNGGTLGNFPSLEGNFRIPSFFSDSLDRLWSEEQSNWIPAVNITERAEDFKIDLSVPGMEKSDFQVEVENGVLTVSGERKEETLEEKEKVTRREFRYGSFKRSFNLPESVNQEAIQANYTNGILSLVVGKLEEAKEKTKKLINIQ